MFDAGFGSGNEERIESVLISRGPRPGSPDRRRGPGQTFEKHFHAVRSRSPWVFGWPLSRSANGWDCPQASHVGRPSLLLLSPSAITPPELSGVVVIGAKQPLHRRSHCGRAAAPLGHMEAPRIVRRDDRIGREREVRRVRPPARLHRRTPAPRAIEPRERFRVNASARDQPYDGAGRTSPRGRLRRGWGGLRSWSAPRTVAETVLLQPPKSGRADGRQRGAITGRRRIGSAALVRASAPALLSATGAILRARQDWLGVTEFVRRRPPSTARATEKP